MVIDRNCNETPKFICSMPTESITEPWRRLQGKGLFQRQANEDSGTSLRLPLKRRRVREI